MALPRGEVISLIHCAFQGVTLGDGIGLFEGHALDDYKSEAVRAECRTTDEKENWSAISRANLEWCGSSLSFFDAAGMRFHLPAFMVEDLREQLVSADPIFHLTYLHERHDLNEYQKQRWALLSNDQRAAVREYLHFIRDDPSHSYEHPAVRRALAEYWDA